MAKGIRKAARLHEHAPVALGELIHAQVRVAIETAVHEELAIALGAGHALTVQKPRLRFYSEVAKWFSVE